MKKITKIWALLTVMLTLSAPAFPQNSFYLQPAAIEPGTTGTLEFALDNAKSYYGFQAIITFPVGIDVAKTSDGKPDVALTDRCKEGNYQVVTNLVEKERKLYVGVFSASDPQVAIQGESGKALLEIKVNAAASFRGDRLTVTGIKFVTSEDKDDPLGNTSEIIRILPNSITLTPSSVRLFKGVEGRDSFTPDLSYTPDNEYLVKTIKSWSSDEPKIATVDDGGKISTSEAAEGKAIITVTSINDKTATCEVIVTTPTDGLHLFPEEITMEKGSTQLFEVLIVPPTASGIDIKWASSNESVASVGNIDPVKGETAVITAEGDGEAIISIRNATGSYSDEAKVTVVTSPQRIDIDPVADLHINRESPTLRANIYPADASRIFTDELAWTSSDESVATVDAMTGKVTPLKLGETVITATCPTLTGWVSGSIVVRVVPIPVASITIEPSAAKLYVGGSVVLTPTVLPEDATYKDVTWTSSDESIATVDQDGKVTAQALGNATITARCGEATAECMITVIETPATGIVVMPDAVELLPGQTTELTATLEPEDVTDQGVVWSSSNTDIATVDESGKVTAIAVGYAVISASPAGNPDVKGECKVAVFPIQAESITLSKPEDIEVGQSFTLTATVLPEDVTGPTVIWTSDNTEIATVDELGKVTGVSLGKTTITATCGTASASCEVTVIRTPVTRISLSRPDLLMRVGYQSELQAIVHPDNATDKRVTWTSSNSSIASVDDNGTVKALAVGSTVITVTSVSDPDVKAVCQVTVETADNIIAVSGIAVTPKTHEMLRGDNFTLKATVTPDDATDKSVTWKSSDLSIATVSAEGVVTAVNVGMVDIYATSSNGLTDICQVKVTSVDPTSVSLNRTNMLMIVGDKSELIAIVRPDEARDKSVTWTSSDETIATVDQNGMVTAVAPGNTVVTATTANGCTATCFVRVVLEIITVDNITVDPTELSLVEGDTYNLRATVTPDNATDAAVTWRSSDEEIATVDQNGVVTAIHEGTATIYVSASNGQTVECAVTVTPAVVPVISISLSNTELLMRVGHTSELLEIVRPDNATDKRVTWRSADESIASVNDKGIVTANAIGTTTIIVTSVYDPSITAECKVIVGDESDISAVTKITVDPTELSLIEGDTYKLTATVTPTTATDKSVTWKSSDRAVATVDENGVVTAVSEGTATIYVSSSNGLTVECKVTVAKKIVPVTGISLSNTELLMRLGYTSELIAIVRPDDATDKRVTWRSEDESIASVDQNGIVTANAIGTVKVIVTSVYDPTVTAVCLVTVQPEDEIIAISEISVNPTELILTEGETYKLTATVKPANATDKSVTWKSSDRAVATVDENGVVTAVSGGTATIYVSSSNGLTVECKVTVIPAVIPVESISLSNTELLMRVGYTSELIAIVRPENATDKRVTWKSADPSIATVDANGIVTAKAVGTVVILVTSVFDPSVTAECRVTVENESDIVAVEGISVKPTVIDIFVGDTYELVATVTPADATDRTVTWKSSDKAVATVSEDGVVTGVEVGTATIYVSSSNGLTAECIVRVHFKEIEATGISLTNSELLMRVGDTAELIAIVIPSNATDQTVTWTSSDESIATVDDKGIVTAISPGLTIITATTANGLKAYCFVTVVPVVIAVTDITLSELEITIAIGETYTLEAFIEPEDATDKTVTWVSSNRAIATVSQEGVVTGISEGVTSVYATASNGLSVECKVTVVRKVDVTAISLNKTELYLTEGEHETLIATIEPEDATDKTVIWTSADTDVATVDNNGTVTAVREGVTIVTATTSNGLTAECRVTVMKRPSTPRQLLRKGDGTTCTFVILMDISDSELAELGYRFAVGYNDGSGRPKIIATTSVRYCHTTPEIFNNPGYDFWAFAYVENAEGKTVSSGLRYLDGTEGAAFDSSMLESLTRGRGASAAESDDWIVMTPSGLHISTGRPEEMHVAVYTPAGIQVLARSYAGDAMAIDETELSRLATGVYVVTVSCGGEVKSKKIVIR